MNAQEWAVNALARTAAPEPTGLDIFNALAAHAASVMQDVRDGHFREVARTTATTNGTVIITYRREGT